MYSLDLPRLQLRNDVTAADADQSGPRDSAASICTQQFSKNAISSASSAADLYRAAMRTEILILPLFSDASLADSNEPQWVVFRNQSAVPS
jgi:hypothetical protein